MHDIKEIRHHLANELQTRMEKFVITERHLVLNCRCRKTTIREYIQGNCLPNLWTLSLLAEYLDCTVNELLGFGEVHNIKNLEDSCAFSTYKDEDSFAFHVRDRILARMKTIDMDREELASVTGFTRESIDKWTWLYPHLPQLMKFLTICDALETTPSDLLGY